MWAEVCRSLHLEVTVEAWLSPSGCPSPLAHAATAPDAVALLETLTLPPLFPVSGLWPFQQDRLHRPLRHRVPAVLCLISQVHRRVSSQNQTRSGVTLTENCVCQSRAQEGGEARASKCIPTGRPSQVPPIFIFFVSCEALAPTQKLLPIFLLEGP